MFPWDVYTALSSESGHAPFTLLVNSGLDHLSIDASTRQRRQPHAPRVSCTCLSSYRLAHVGGKNGRDLGTNPPVLLALFAVGACLIQAVPV